MCGWPRGRSSRSLCAACAFCTRKPLPRRSTAFGYSAMVVSLRVLLAIAFASALLVSAAALPVPAIATPSASACDCPQPGQCDEHSCPAGCFAHTGNHCVLAPAGSYAQLTNVSASNKDVPCESGSYTSVPGSSACNACPAGTFASQSGSTSCSVCPAGTQCPFAGMILPFPCTAGSFSSTAGSIRTSMHPHAFCFGHALTLPLVCRLRRLPCWLLLPSHWHDRASPLLVGRRVSCRLLHLPIRSPRLHAPPCHVCERTVGNFSSESLVCKRASTSAAFIARCSRPPTRFRPLFSAAPPQSARRCLAAGGRRRA
jgi:hypothetical protein